MFSSFDELVRYLNALLNRWLGIAGALLGVVELARIYGGEWAGAWLKPHGWKFAVLVVVAAQFGAYLEREHQVAGRRSRSHDSAGKLSASNFLRVSRS